MRVRTFVSDLLEQLLNRRVSRLIFHDDQNLRLGIARRVSGGSRGRGGAREVTGKSLSTAMGEEVETVVPRSGGRAETGGATARDAIRVFGRTLRPSGNFGRVARMRSWVDALGCIAPACMFRGEGPLRIPPKCSLRFACEVEDEGKNLRRFGGSLLGSLFGWTKPRPLGSASRKGCGGKRREPTAPSISRAPWVLECRAVGTCGVFFFHRARFRRSKNRSALLSFTAINSNRCTEHRVCTAANVCPK